MHSIYLTACCAAHKGCVDNHSSGNPDVCCDFWFKHNFERDRGRCCMKLYCTPAAVIQLCLPLCTLNTKREKDKWKPEQSTKISYISSRDLHNFPFFSPFPPSCPSTPLSLCLAFKCLANKLAALFPFSWIFSHFHIPFFWFFVRLHFRLLCQRGVWLMPVTDAPGNAFNKWHQKLKLATGV